MQYLQYTTPLFVAAAVMTTLAVHGWRRRTTPCALPFAVMMFLAVIWQVTYAVEIGVPGLGGRIFLQKLRLPALTFLPLVVFWLSVEYTGRHAWVKRRWAPALLVIPVVSVFLGLTAGLHKLHRYDYRVDLTGYIPALVSKGGPWFVIQITQSYSLVLASVAILAASMCDAHPANRWRYWVLGFSILAPTLLDCLNTIGRSPVPGYNLAPASMMITGLVLAWVVFRKGILEIVPIARSTAVDHMGDLLLVLVGHLSRSWPFRSAGKPSMVRDPGHREWPCP